MILHLKEVSKVRKISEEDKVLLCRRGREARRYRSQKSSFNVLSEGSHESILIKQSSQEVITLSGILKYEEYL